MLMSQDNSGGGGPALPKRLRNTVLRGRLSLTIYTYCNVTLCWGLRGGIGVIFSLTLHAVLYRFLCKFLQPT